MAAIVPGGTPLYSTHLGSPLTLVKPKYPKEPQLRGEPGRAVQGGSR